MVSSPCLNHFCAKPALTATAFLPAISWL
jgi:hypothetical protein